MNSYAFFFNQGTFKKIHEMFCGGVVTKIDYVGSADKKPFNQFQVGDELFVVGLRLNRVYLAGRMVVGAAPISRERAVSQSGRTDLRANVDLICFADPEKLDDFRPAFTLPLEVARDLVLITTKNEAMDVSSLKRDEPEENIFRSCPRLSPESASALRTVLGLDRPLEELCEHPDASSSAPEFDDDEYRNRAIKTRRGQQMFRQRLLVAYQGRCAVTNCQVEPLLEAAHLTPHAEMTDYRVSNGLLLRADIHTLFDLNLIAVNENYKIVVSPKIRESEYWRYSGLTMNNFPDKSADQPNRAALQTRVARLLP